MSGSGKPTRTTSTATASATDGASTTQADAPPREDVYRPSGSRLGRYELQAVVGRGGMGIVFRAHDPALGRPLAIKVLHAHRAGARAQVRFLEEARTMAKLRHPAVLPVFDVGRIGCHVHVVMPLITGGTLADWMRAPRPWRDVTDRFVRAGRGLAAAHAAGLVHRDFKPSNVLVDADGSVLVSDFGIAAHVPDVGDDPTAYATTSTIAGTPAYMAPEQARGDRLDARADQFSFCVSYWEGLFGERPHEASTQSARTDDRIPRWLSAALLRGISANPMHRWPSMTALLDHIDERRTDRRGDGSAPARRRWIWVCAAALVVAVITAVVMGDGHPRRPASVPAPVGEVAPRPPPPPASAASPDEPHTVASERVPPAAPKPRRAWRRPRVDPPGGTREAEDLSRSRF